MLKIEQIAALRRFVGPGQMSAIIHVMRGEEGAFFREKITECADRFAAMPKTYEQDGLGDDAIASLHYFRGNMDWYITERDVETPDEPGQHRAFGLANLGYGGELGYINIFELIQNGVELDLYFTPCTLGSVRSDREVQS